MALTVFLLAMAAVAPGLTSSQVASNSTPKQNPLVGTWMANLEKSILSPSFKPQSVILQIAQSGETVTLSSHIVNASGQDVKVAETFRTDGTATPGTLTPGVLLVARWLDRQVLTTLARKGDDVIALVTYQVSADGQTLTSRSSGLGLEQVIVFERK